MVYPALLPLMRTPRLPAVDWTDAPRRFKWTRPFIISKEVDSSWNVMAHSDAREGKWRGNWRMQWVVSTLHTTSEHGVSSITTADAHTSAASSRLNWRPTADLNGLVRFAGRRNMVSACVTSHFKRSLAVFSVNSSALIAKAVDTFETSVNIYQTACTRLVFILSEVCMQDVDSWLTF